MSVETGALPVALPAGYRTRAFEDAHREALVEISNEGAHPMQVQTAEEWRHWERIAPPPADELRLTVVGPAGTIAGGGSLGPGWFPSSDRALNLGVGIASGHRGRGIGSALLTSLESEAKRRGSPRVRSGASASRPASLAWAERRGYREIGRRIQSYVELAGFDRSRFEKPVAAARDAGLALRAFAAVLEERDDAGREAFYRAVWEAEAPMWDDVPWASPTPHWTYERFHKMAIESGDLLADCSIVAFDAETIAGFTTTGRRGERDGNTWMTGVARTHRGRGLAQALKVEALSRAKARGLRAMLTTNDEPNKPMRGINAKLGYQMLPAHVQLEKEL